MSPTPHPLESTSDGQHHHPEFGSPSLGHFHGAVRFAHEEWGGGRASEFPLTPLRRVTVFFVGLPGERSRSAASLRSARTPPSGKLAPLTTNIAAQGALSAGRLRR
ncbi:unnamed protein product [Lampetra fluviatilis]